MEFALTKGTMSLLFQDTSVYNGGAHNNRGDFKHLTYFVIYDH